MNPPKGYEIPTIGETINSEFLWLNGNKWCAVNACIGGIIRKHDIDGSLVRPKNKHWNPLYSTIKRPDGFRFLELGEIIKASDSFINELNRVERIGDSASKGYPVKNYHYPIIRPITPTKPKSEKPTALQLANAKIKTLTKELEELKSKVKNLAAGLN